MKISIPIRLFLGYFLIVCISVVTFFVSSVDQVELAVDQATEETMVDTANLLAELVEHEFLAAQFEHGEFGVAFEGYLGREFRALDPTLRSRRSRVAWFAVKRSRRARRAVVGESGRRSRSWRGTPVRGGRM